MIKRGKYFPCKECTYNFHEMIKEHPLRANTRSEFMIYVCEVHNIVNKRIGKPIFPCEKVFEIWGQNDCGCGVKKFWKAALEND